jgi:hypothetical protein
MNTGDQAKNRPEAAPVPAFVVEHLHATSNWLAILAIGAVIAVIMLTFSILDTSGMLLKASKKDGATWYPVVLSASIAGLLLTAWATGRLISCIIAIWKLRGDAPVDQVEKAFINQHRMWIALAVVVLCKLTTTLVSSPLAIWNAMDEIRQRQQWDAELENLRRRNS